MRQAGGFGNPKTLYERLQKQSAAIPGRAQENPNMVNAR